MVVTELRRHRLEQAERLFRLGVRATADQHVVAQADGKQLQPNSLTHAFTDFVAARGLKRVRFHDLRHSHATHMLGAGVHPKIASERLGHSKVGITLDLYSHVLPGMQDEAASQVNALISGEIERHRDAAKKIR
jgi:integrase